MKTNKWTKLYIWWDRVGSRDGCSVFTLGMKLNPPVATSPPSVPDKTQEHLLGDALLSVLVASGMICKGAEVTGPELLMFADEYVRSCSTKEGEQ